MTGTLRGRCSYIGRDRLIDMGATIERDLVEVSAFVGARTFVSGTLFFPRTLTLIVTCFVVVIVSCALVVVGGRSTTVVFGCEPDKRLTRFFVVSVDSIFGLLPTLTRSMRPVVMIL